MKVREKSSFSAFAAGEEKHSKKSPNKRMKKNSQLSKTSVDPLYKTTDQYRQVIKPMKVEDFLSK